MAGTPAGKVAAAKADPRHPDTEADRVEPVAGSPADVDPALYGFSKIDGTQPAEGPGFLEPVRAEAYASPENSTFAGRAKARTKVVTPDDADVTGK